MSAHPDAIPLRLLRAVAAVAEHGSVTRAAAALHQSASAVTRAVQRAEARLGLALFERAARGMVPTAAASLLATRLQRALHELRCGGGAAFALRATDAMLHTLIALASTRSQAGAARGLGISQVAVSQTLRKLEHATRLEVGERRRQTLRLTESGEVLLRHTKLALAEIRIGLDELAGRRGRPMGRVAIGALPMASDVLVPQALSRLLASEPGLQATVIDGTYEALLHQLRHGDLDLVVGPLRGAGAAADVVEQRLFVDRLLPVVRRDHPLMRATTRLRLRDTLDWPWIGPLPGTPARSAFERAFQAVRLSAPTVRLQANSPAVLRSVLLAGDAIALISPLQIQAELRSGLLVRLPLGVSGTQRSIGVTLRRDGLPSAAATRLMAELQVVVATAGPRRRASDGHLPAPP